MKDMKYAMFTKHVKIFRITTKRFSEMKDEETLFLCTMNSFVITKHLSDTEAFVSKFT